MSIITHDFDDVLQKLLSKAQNYEQPLIDWYGWMQRQTQLTFSKLGKKGNTVPFRGIKWRWFADQYTRKDGTVVPAEGIPGQVKGRLRKSGKGKTGTAADRHRVTISSRMMRDTRLMEKAALSRYRIGKFYAVMRTPTQYAKFQQKLRPFVFITEKDTDILTAMIEKYLVS